MATLLHGVSWHDNQVLLARPYLVVAARASIHLLAVHDAHLFLVGLCPFGEHSPKAAARSRRVCLTEFATILAWHQAYRWMKSITNGASAAPMSASSTLVPRTRNE